MKQTTQNFLEGESPTFLKKNTKNWLSQERKELFKQNKNHFSYFLRTITWLKKYKITDASLFIKAFIVLNPLMHKVPEWLYTFRKSCHKCNRTLKSVWYFGTLRIKRLKVQSHQCRIWKENLDVDLLV